MSDLHSYDLDPEDQVKSFQMSYPEYCLLIEAVSVATMHRAQLVSYLEQGALKELAAARREEAHRLESLYQRLVGEA